MILNIEVGENDSGNNPIRIFATLEGPLSDLDIRQMWKIFEANIEGTIGRCPQRPFQASPQEERTHKELYNLWSANRDALHAVLKKEWGVAEEETEFLITRYFIAFLKRHHGYKDIESVDLFTENW